jgi:hypothetical protein
MTASSRFGYSMFTGAVLSGALVGYERIKCPAQMAAAAAGAHAREGTMLLSAYVALALVTGVIIFVVATAVHVRNRPQRRAPAAPARQRSYGGYR